MLKSKLLSDISISTVQTILNQLSGIVVFFIISKNLDKSSLGQINWAFAVLMLVFPVLGFGLEQVALKRVATGTNPALLMQSYLVHVGVTGFSFIGILLIIRIWAPVLQQNGHFFLLLSVSQCLSFFATPFKQVASGLEKFRALFIMTSCSNIIKVVCLLLLALLNRVSLTAVIYIYLLASLGELVLSVIVYRVKLGLSVLPGFEWTYYLAFIKEAFPQLGITIINASVLRMDKVLLGLISTSVMVAEYSFSNRLFEMSILPLWIVAPVVFPKIAKLFRAGDDPVDSWKMDYLKTFARIELIVAVLVALIVNICWKDVIDPLTDNKYGASTKDLMLVMSFAMPLVYLNNLFWGINFSKGRMKIIFVCILITFLTVVAADVLLIPVFSAMGAAMGFLISTIVQTIYYSGKTKFVDKAFYFHGALIYGNGLAAGLIATYSFSGIVPQAIIAVAIYFFLLLLTRELSIRDWLLFRKIADV